MNLVELIKEVDYQKEYSYEKRVELFNKYQISTSQNYFNPIYELAFYIHKSTYLFNDWERPRCYSHSGAVASSFNKDLNFNSEGMLLKNDKVYVNKRCILLKVFDKYKENYEPTFKSYVRFNIDTKTVSVNSGSQLYNIVRDLYEKIDEWLIDFGYKAW